MINLNFKGGVKTSSSGFGISTWIFQAIVSAAEIYHNHGSTLTITSIFDGKHMNGSKHYVGQAFDCRTYDLTEKQLQSIFADLKISLKPVYDVLLEKDHIHIEIH